VVWERFRDGGEETELAMEELDLGNGDRGGFEEEGVGRGVQGGL
jgi:hypothetical protein